MKLTPLAAEYLPRPWDTLRILRNDDLVSLLFDFLELPDADRGWNEKTGTPFVFGPRLDGKASGWSLAEAFYRQKVGKWKKLPGSLGAVWLKRLLLEAGLIVPADVRAAPLPASAPIRAQRVWEGFTLLLSLSWIERPGSPAPFVRSFARDWCGMGERQAYAGIAWLIDNGKMIPAQNTGRYEMYVPTLAAGTITVDEISAKHSDLKGVLSVHQS